MVSMVEKQTDDNLSRGKELDDPEFKQLLTLLVKNKYKDRRTKHVIHETIPNVKMVIVKAKLPAEVNKTTINLGEYIDFLEPAKGLKEIRHIYTILLKQAMRTIIGRKHETLRNALLVKSSALLYLKLFVGFTSKDGNYSNKTDKEDMELYGMVLMYFIMVQAKVKYLGAEHMVRNILKDQFKDSVDIAHLANVNLENMQYENPAEFFGEISDLTGRPLTIKTFLGYQVKYTKISIEGDINFGHFVGDIYAALVSDGYNSLFLQKLFGRDGDNFIKIVDSVL